MLSTGQAFFHTIVFGLILYLCRLIPFLIIKPQIKKQENDESEPAEKPGGFLAFVEGIVPPIIMTVLAFNSLLSPVRENPPAALPAIIAALTSALAHLWKRNTLLSIGGGTLAYMFLIRVMPHG